MRVDIICVGNELLTGLVENTNAGYLSRRLISAGIAVRQSSVVADETVAIKAALRQALQYSDAVICTGGLGPTDDDITRETVAELLGLQLQLNQDWLEKLEKFFLDRGYQMPRANRKQALMFEGSLLIDNLRGTAPGSVTEWGKQLIILLPGPPQELQPMFEESILPLLAGKLQGRIFHTRTLKCIGLGESLLEEKIKDLGRWEQPSLSLVARGLEVMIQLKAYGEQEETAALLEQSVARLRQSLNGFIYGEADDTLPQVVAELLIGRGLTLALAESCSGGLLADTLTDIPGSSRFFTGGAVTYSLNSKQLLPGLTKKILHEHGAVSAAAAEALARGARTLFAANVGVGITGIAGPESDDSGRPVGLVYVAAAFSKQLLCKEFMFIGTRRSIKERAVQAALTLLWRALTGREG